MVHLFFVTNYFSFQMQDRTEEVKGGNNITEETSDSIKGLSPLLKFEHGSVARHLNYSDTKNIIFLMFKDAGMHMCFIICSLWYSFQ